MVKLFRQYQIKQKQIPPNQPVLNLLDLLWFTFNDDALAYPLEQTGIWTISPDCIPNEMGAVIFQINKDKDGNMSTAIEIFLYFSAIVKISAD